jgi:putative tryptophan/tyrosine transport system substrate-binding protein
VAAPRNYVSAGENFVAKLPRNSAPGYGSASIFASVFTGRSCSNGRAPAARRLRRSPFRLVVNMKTAKALGLTIPPALLRRADQLIEL